jgi:hypothetical protein
MMNAYKKSLSEFKLTDYTVESNGVRVQEIFVKGGKTGRMVHRATSGSSCLGCGHWCKYVVNNWKLTAQQADRMERCEKCFGSQWQERIDDKTAKHEQAVQRYMRENALTREDAECRVYEDEQREGK